MEISFLMKITIFLIGRFNSKISSHKPHREKQGSRVEAKHQCFVGKI